MCGREFKINYRKNNINMKKIESVDDVTKINQGVVKAEGMQFSNVELLLIESAL